ncbi:uncharacterized protein UDID_20238 [Ustilago sp. UG-2017a]|nr:uncharacterized protein UDID_20238 [Ustilago sp. UG-2017a]
MTLLRGSKRLAGRGVHRGRRVVVAGGATTCGASQISWPLGWRVIGTGAEKEHQKAIKKEHKLQARLEKAQAKYNEAVRTLEEKKMKVDNTNRSLADHRGKTQNAEQHLASAQHNKATGEQERHRHKEALAANTDAPVTGGPGNGAPVQTQPVTQLRNTNVPANAAQPAGYNIHQTPATTAAYQPAAVGAH